MTVIHRALVLLLVFLLCGEFTHSLTAETPSPSQQEQEAFFRRQFQTQFQHSVRQQQQEQQQGKRPNINSPVKIDIPGNGVLNPSKHHQRYRLNEYDKRNAFYQWWYFYIQDLELNRHYAMSYGMTKCNRAANCQFEMAALMFAMIDNKSGAHFQKYEVFPLSHWIVHDEFHVQVYNQSVVSAIDDGKINTAGAQLLFELKPLSDDKIRLTGQMKESSKNVWIVEGVQPNTPVSWDITIERVYGYYAQDVFERPDEWFRGVIMWNTYAHNSLVHDAQISIGGQNQYLDHATDPSGTRYRAYGDGNWGQLMPDNEKHPEDLDYSWGWFQNHLPNKNPQLDVSVIAGTGKSYTSFPFYTMEGKFGDVRLNSTVHIEFREVTVYKIKLTSCNDGKLLRFNVQRNNWTTINDQFGSAQIPLDQTVTMESENWIVIQDCKSVPSNYNRLLFPFKDFVFSDFEGLGAVCRLTVKYKVTGEIVIDRSNIQSGIEYGFRYNTRNVPPMPWK